jgi:hypothetical protein
MTHLEIDGKTITGRMVREWSEGMESNIRGRKCRIVRFGKRNKARVLVRWLESLDRSCMGPCLPGNAGMGRTQWVGMYEIEPDTYVPGYPR